MAEDYFIDRGSFFYSSKYRPLINCFTKLSGLDEVSKTPLYQNVPQVLVMAAAIGLSKNLTEAVDTKDRSDVFIGGVNNTKIHGESVAHWVALIVWLKQDDLASPILKVENDTELCNIFNELAMGGLSYLERMQFKSGLTDPSGRELLTDELIKAIKKVKKK